MHAHAQAMITVRALQETDDVWRTGTPGMVGVDWGLEKEGGLLRRGASVGMEWREICGWSRLGWREVQPSTGITERSNENSYEGRIDRALAQESVQRKCCSSEEDSNCLRRNVVRGAVANLQTIFPPKAPIEEVTTKRWSARRTH